MDTNPLSELSCNKPYFIIIGAQKCGTSSLFYYLAQHSQLSLPTTKEIHFFDKHFNNGIEWYMKQLPDEKKTGEASPYYLYHPRVPERVFSSCQKTKLIVMLRNPVDRAYSHFMMQKNRGIEPLTFEEAFKAEKDRVVEEEKIILDNPYYNSLSHQQLSYFARGKYYSQLKRWVKYFPIEQFLFIKSERFFESPLKELSRVCSFLKIQQEMPESLSPQNTNEYYEMNSGTRQFLNNYYLSEIKELSELLGSDFSWDIS